MAASDSRTSQIYFRHLATSTSALLLIIKASALLFVFVTSDIIYANPLSTYISTSLNKLYLLYSLFRCITPISSAPHSVVPPASVRFPPFFLSRPVARISPPSSEQRPCRFPSRTCALPPSPSPVGTASAKAPRSGKTGSFPPQTGCYRSRWLFAAAAVFSFSCSPTERSL